MYEHNVKDTNGNYCEHNIKWSLDIKLANSTSSGAWTSSLQTQHQGELKKIESKLELLQLMKNNAKQKNWREQKHYKI
jgi:hypothetical protein